MLLSGAFNHPPGAFSPDEVRSTETSKYPRSWHPPVTLLGFRYDQLFTIIDFLALILEKAASNVWIDHVELSSDLDHDKDYVGVAQPAIDSNLTLRSTMGSLILLMDAPT